MTPPLEEPSCLTPREIVIALDRYIVGQNHAKRAVAVALRNRWRRQRVAAGLRDEISPKNIILIGPTGVGKTEIARRLARLARAPFLKVEASKFTEVGYVGRDVESIVRELTEAAIQMVRQEARLGVKEAAERQADARVLDLLLPTRESDESPGATPHKTREKLEEMLRTGDLDSREIEIESTQRPAATMPSFSIGAGPEGLGAGGLQDLMSQMMGPKSQKKRVRVAEARVLLREEEADKLVDKEWVQAEGVKRAQERGIVFLDEIDKIAKREGTNTSGDVSREGVQRDLLPIVEGSSVTTKYGPVKTDHVLFIAAGAFHVAKVSDLIPELQGRFPVRVELDSLAEAELLRILVEPTNALPKQYQALLETEGVALTFEITGLRHIARLAAEANSLSQNIGARRLHALLEKILEDLAFEAPDARGAQVSINEAYVTEKIGSTLEKEDLARYIL